MKLTELFESRDKKKRLSHMKNLISLSLVDGIMENSEMHLISKIAARVGINPEDIDRIKQRPESVKFVPPQNHAERIEQLYELIIVMMIDGELHENEIAYCQLVAVNLGFNRDVVEFIVDKTIEMVGSGIDAETTLSRIQKMLA